MEINPELAALVDRLRERHPAFRRTTIERLVLRTAREVGSSADDVPLAVVQEAADAQLTYVDEGAEHRSSRRSG